MLTEGLTVGVEEEFLLVDPTGALAPVAPDVLRRVADDRVKPELMRYQVETTSGVCTDLGDLERQLADLRHAVAEAAVGVGAHLVAAGAPLRDGSGVELLTQTDRYRALATHFPDAAATSGTCACQVHVGIGDRELAVQVLGRLRPWLPTLFALSTNSPVSGGRDSGWSSTRYGRQLRWPTFTAPAPWRTAAAYDRAVRSLVGSGAALDPRNVYFLARLSPRYPTIEIRVADTALEVADAVLLAGVCRALVSSLVEDVRRGRPSAVVSDPDLRADLLDVAAHGAPTSERAHGATWADLLRTILPGLRLTGDAELVMAGLDRVARIGTGAVRQRRLLAGSRDLEHFVPRLAATAVSDAPVQGSA
ncbi:carboxylate-amine ligase [Nocardioides sediminis]|uniref:carboxylate-amine ligase n=1 Tax=Nocardioides sediminis TaxID=433648 RepID=UPI00131ED71C|nr:YbdK family carboxylate-amine ligase [Nocardioides sediminis]